MVYLLWWLSIHVCLTTETLPTPNLKQINFKLAVLKYMYLQHN